MIFFFFTLFSLFVSLKIDLAYEKQDRYLGVKLKTNEVVKGAWLS